MKLRLLALCLGLASPASAATPTEAAIALYQAKQFSAARAALEKITAAEPGNAAACFYLGHTLRLRGDAASYEEAVKWLEQATHLEPTNAAYLADYGGTSMEFAGKIKATSKLKALSAATTGRDAMERALILDPGNLDARTGLLQFYSQAPWPIGSSAKAYAQAEEIRKRNATRGLLAFVTLKVGERKYSEAFALSEAFLSSQPASYVALHQLGRTAAISGQNIERGIAALQQCLSLTPPPNYPTHAGVQYRLGTLFERKGDLPAARAAYEAALKLEPGNQSAAGALAKLR
ncbi:MAG: tetratricopeptide repeat protein [Opitutaceae bacterium]|nr:tetratricopeptide repeat protein [Opitutaceae bacterium]